MYNFFPWVDTANIIKIKCCHYLSCDITIDNRNKTIFKLCILNIFFFLRLNVLNASHWVTWLQSNLLCILCMYIYKYIVYTPITVIIVGKKWADWRNNEILGIIWTLNNLWSIHVKYVYTWVTNTYIYP